MIQLKNENGFLFTEEERLFMDFLMFKKRILLFRQAGANHSAKFEAGEYERSVVQTIKGLQFVKSRHIENILSESAKLAIRDFIDEITARSNNKIEQICAQIVNQYAIKVENTGKDIAGIITIKDEVIKLAEEIKGCKKEQILPILQAEVPKDKMQDFEEDFASVLFFKGIYDKTSTYFSNLVNKIYAELSHLLTLLDKRILTYQKEEQQEIQRKKEEKEQKIKEEKREEEKKIAMEHCDKMDELKLIAQNMINDKRSLAEEIKAAMKALSAVEEDLRKVKVDAVSLKKLSKEIDNEFERIDTTFFQKRSVR